MRSTFDLVMKFEMSEIFGHEKKSKKHENFENLEKSIFKGKCEEKSFFRKFEIFEIFRKFRDFFTSEIFGHLKLLSQI